MEVSQLLDSYFHGANDLANLHSLQQGLESECGQLEIQLQDARSRARQAAADGSAQMHAIAASLEALCGFCEDRSSSVPPAEAELVRELSDLADEVSRVAQVRAYVDAVLQLERLVGDLEDGVVAAASATPVVSRGAAGSPSQAGQFVISAVNSLAAIEKLMHDIVEWQPQWDRLISAVDVRVDRAAAALRPVVISDYRSIVISIGWPPPLSISSDRDDQLAKSHPLLQLQGDARRKFRESFVSLSRFQAVQIQRKRRESRGYGNKSSVPREALWSIEELVHPIAAKAEVHFKQWLHKPEFVFALAYRITQLHAGIVDALLQPMLDEEFLGYSAREEWISSVVATVAEHLRRWALPTLMEDFEETSLSDQASTVWLHTVDQTLAFDSKMQALVAKGIGMSSGNEEFSGSVFGVRRPCIAVFSDRGDWLEVWTSLELGDTRKKVAVEYGNEAAWKMNAASSLSGSTEFKPPLTAYRLTTAAWNLVDRCRSLPEANQRLQFVRKTAVPVLEEFIGELLQRCQESEAVTALADEPSMVKVGVCLNAARYCENTVRDWCEDFFFLELRLAELQESSPASSPAAEEELSQIEGSVFDWQLEKLSRFRNSWIGKLVSVVSRGFDARCREYFRNKRRWSEETGAPSFEDTAPSGSLVEALAALQSQLSSLRNSLDQANFVELWQRLIPSLDQLLFQGLVLGGARFSEQGARQFGSDVKSLFLIFRPYCARPASFFSAVSDAMKLLALDSQQAFEFLERLRSYDSDDEQEEDLLARLRSVCGVRKMTASVAYRVLSSRLL